MTAEITFLPHNKVLKVRPGTDILRASREARVHIPTRCSGKASCLMCKIEVEPGYEAGLNPPTDAEHRKLGPLLKRGFRLACQAQVMGKAVIKLPEDPLKAAIRKQLEQKANEELW